MKSWEVVLHSAITCCCINPDIKAIVNITTDVWRSVGRRLATPMGRVLLSRMSDEARTFVHETLLSAGVRPDGRDELRR